MKMKSVKITIAAYEEINNIRNRLMTEATLSGNIDLSDALRAMGIGAIVSYILLKEGVQPKSLDPGRYTLAGAEA